jgi:hypothetical protein
MMNWTRAEYLSQNRSFHDQTTELTERPRWWWAGVLAAGPARQLHPATACLSAQTPKRDLGSAMRSMVLRWPKKARPGEGNRPSRTTLATVTACTQPPALSTGRANDCSVSGRHFEGGEDGLGCCILGRGNRARRDSASSPCCPTRATFILTDRSKLTRISLEAWKRAKNPNSISRCVVAGMLTWR